MSKDGMKDAAQSKDGMSKDGAKSVQSKDGMSKDGTKDSAQSNDGMSKDGAKNAQSKDGMSRDGTKDSAQSKDGTTQGRQHGGQGQQVLDHHRQRRHFGDRSSAGRKAHADRLRHPSEKSITETTNVNFNISVGTRVPSTVRFHPLPPRIVEIYPEWRGYQVILVSGRYVIVRPQTHEIVYIIEG